MHNLVDKFFAPVFAVGKDPAAHRLSSLHAPAVATSHPTLEVVGVVGSEYFTSNEVEGGGFAAHGVLLCMRSVATLILYIIPHNTPSVKGLWQVFFGWI